MAKKLGKQYAQEIILEEIDRSWAYENAMRYRGLSGLQRNRFCHRALSCACVDSGGDLHFTLGPSAVCVPVAAGNLRQVPPAGSPYQAALRCLR